MALELTPSDPLLDLTQPARIPALALRHLQRGHLFAPLGTTLLAPFAQTSAQQQQSIDDFYNFNQAGDPVVRDISMT